MTQTHVFNSARGALIATLLIVALGAMSFFVFEPSIGHSQITDEFTVSQTITNEISFNVTATDVTMTGAIAGLTGGYATGTTVVSVNTNNVTGYNMKLHFATNTVAHAMVASSTDPSSAYIGNYTPAVAGVPDYTWVDNASGQSAEFGYTVTGTTPGEVDPSFMNNTSSCNAGTNETANRCWLNPTTTPETIINSTASNSNSTTTLTFKVAVPNAPSPALPSGVYIATGTLTATTNP
jgi:hypothetical protein